jgi:hypothetical protein
MTGKLGASLRMTASEGWTLGEGVDARRGLRMIAAKGSGGQKGGGTELLLGSGLVPIWP